MPTWKKIDQLLKEYRSLNIDDAYNHDLFNRVAITFHSTSIEGSTLTQVEAEVLIESGLPAKGKPLEHSNMVKDHYDALVFACNEAKKKRVITSEFIQEIAAHVMKSTGGMVNQMGGSYDSSRGELRKGSVMAGSAMFPEYKKVPDLLSKFCTIISDQNKSVKSTSDILRLSFLAHFHLVSIHPFADGNGRTSRIVMNFMQTLHNLPMGIVHKDEKANYILALEESRKAETPAPIINFLAKEYARFLEEQISQTQKQSKGFSFMF
jgi:Fic family protein